MHPSIEFHSNQVIFCVLFRYEFSNFEFKLINKQLTQKHQSAEFYLNQAAFWILVGHFEF